jgi:CRISPR-associated protein Csb2
MGRVYAAEFRDSRQPEWPANPARLFSALVAAHHDTNGTAGEREALLWLEKQTPPQIIAKQPGKPDEVVAFVPTNYATKSGNTHPESRAKQPRSFPAQGPESPIVHFLWPNAEPSLKHADALQQLTARVASLGRACSLVRMRVINSIPAEEKQPKYVPDDNGTTVLSVAGEGRLEDLEATYLLGRRPQQGTPARYLHLDPSRSTENLVPSHFGEMIVLRRVSGIVFPIESTSLLTQRLRKAFLSHAGEGSKLNPVLSGHDGENPVSIPHVAFAALSNVGGKFGDGRLMGLAVILPASIAKADRRIALRACASIESINLGELGEWKVEIANFDVTQRTLKPDTWMRPARRWNTITPILLDRYPKKNLSTEELLVTACLRAGLPAPSRCTYGTHPNPDEDLKGVPPVFVFAPPRWAVHATFDFDVLVKGPVLVGAGRFLGMGLMRPSHPHEQAASE